MKKATRHRKRIAPPGPCGVLWQMQRGREGKSSSKSASKVNQQHHPPPSQNKNDPPFDEESSDLREEETEESALDVFPNRNNRNALFENEKDSKKQTKTNNNNEDDHGNDTSTPPAWTTMQQSLGIVTPYLPIGSQGNTQQRYEMLRPHLSPNCVLVSEILLGRHDLQLLDPSFYLCAWVDSIDETNAHHGIWTVVLRDETGATIRAWMEPDFCKKELQKAQSQQHDQQQPTSTAADADPLETTMAATTTTTSTTTPSNGMIRTGVVWMLQRFSLFPIQHQGNGGDDKPVERMLVLSGKHITRVWTPEDHKTQNQPDETEDSPEAQRRYLDWMEQRKSLVVADDNDDDDEGYRRSKENRNATTNDNDGDDDEEHRHHRPSEQEKPQSRYFRDPTNHHHRGDEPTNDCDDPRRRSSQSRVVGGTQHQERMTVMSALTLTIDAEEETFNATQQTMEEPKLPLARRDTNSSIRNHPIDSNNDHCKRSSSILQTQESVQEPTTIGTDDKRLNNIDTRELETNDTERNQESILLDTQPESLERNRREVASRSQRTTQSNNVHENTKKRKRPRDKSPTSSLARGKVSPARRKSPIRMARSIWNTPDPSILELLEAEEANDRAICERDDNQEEDEVETVVWDPSGSSVSTLLRSTQSALEAKSATMEEEGGHRRRDAGDESPLIGAMPSSQRIGGALFEPSSWAGMDMGELSEESSHCVHIEE